MTRAPVAAALLALAALPFASCHPTVTTSRVAAQPAEQFCWWTILRTALPPDSVAARFEHAYTVLGLSGAVSSHVADTAWTHAGPTVLGDGSTGATYASRLVAIRDGDSTNFRYAVEMTGPPRADEQSAGGDNLEFCGAIAHAAAIRWSRPARRPNAEDSLEVWTHMFR
jgi:hypothetical protein